MSPRRHRVKGSAEREDAPAPPFGGSLRRTESYQGEEWVVQTVAGSPGRYFRCPGCDQEIPPGVGHVVAWPDRGETAVEDRRHWHRACWGARERRGANLLRGRGAPKY